MHKTLICFGLWLLLDLGIVLFVQRYGWHDEHKAKLRLIKGGKL